MDDFRCDHAGNGPVHFVLDGLEKLDADLQGGAVVDAGGVYVGDFLVKAPFRGADILDAAQQLVKVIKWLIRIFQALIDILGDIRAENALTPHDFLRYAFCFSFTENPIFCFNQPTLFFCFLKSVPKGSHIPKAATYQ